MLPDGAPKSPAPNRLRILLLASVIGIIIAAVDKYITTNVSLSVLYTVPIAIAALAMPREVVVAASSAAAVIAEQFGPSPWDDGSFARVLMRFIAYTSTGLLVTEIVQSRRLQGENLRVLADEMTRRQIAEEDARALIESSPAAILTIDSDGTVDMANAAAAKLLGNSNLSGELIGEYFPMLGDVMRMSGALTLARTMVETSGKRRNGDMFFAQMWLSSYKTAAGFKLAAVVADASEHLRDREELGLRQLLTNSSIIVGAVSHEIRNLAAAADALYQNVGRSCGIGGSEDFEALGKLIEAMRKLSSSELQATVEQALTGVDVNSMLRELHIILSSSRDDSGVQLAWDVADALPRVRGDHTGLLQVFLNITQNSRRALASRHGARLEISAYQIGPNVAIRVGDNGPGVAVPEALFHPFQPGASATGLGLYVSRAIIRTYGGELQYVRMAGQQCFMIQLPVLGEPAQAAVNA